MCSPSSVAYGIETDFVYAWRMEFSIYNIANYVNTCIFLVDSIASNNIHTHAQRLTIGLSANRNANCREMVTESKRDRAHAWQENRPRRKTTKASQTDDICVYIGIAVRGIKVYRLCLVDGF